MPYQPSSLQPISFVFGCQHFAFAVVLALEVFGTVSIIGSTTQFF
jgi:hypothetical protein